MSRVPAAAGVLALAGGAPLAAVLLRGRPQPANVGLWLATLGLAALAAGALLAGVWWLGRRGPSRPAHGLGVFWPMADTWVFFAAFLLSPQVEAALATRPEIAAGVWAYMALKFATLLAVFGWPRARPAAADPTRGRPAGWNLGATLLGLAVLVFTLNTVFAALLSPVPSDFRVNYLGAYTARQGADPYRDSNVHATAAALRVPYDSTGLWNQVTNPPTALTLFAVLAGLPFGVAVNVWLALNLAAAVALLGALRALARRASPLWWGLAALTLALYPALSETIRLGQVDVLIALALVGAAALAARDRDFAAGGLIAFAAALKIVPALFLLYLLAQRRWRAGIGFALGLGALVGLSFVVIGADAWGSYFDQRVSALARGTALWNNMSLAGFFNRLMLGSTEARTNWWAISDAPLARVLGVAWSLLFVGLAVWHFWGRRRAGPLDWALAAAATLLGVAVAWPHYAMWIVPGIAAVAALDARLLGNGWTRWRPVALVAGLVLMSVNWPEYYQAWRPVFESASLVLNLRNIGLLLVFLALWRAARDAAPGAASTRATGPRAPA